MALLSFILVAGLSATYQIIEGQVAANAHNATQDEGGFAIRKIEWAFTNVRTSDLPPYYPAGAVTDLDITTNYGHIQFCTNNNVLYIRERGSGHSCGSVADGSLPITTANVKVQALQFVYTAAVGATPAALSATVTIDGVAFHTIRYIR